MPATALQTESQLSSFYTGYAVLDFWADWCEPAVQLNQTFDSLSNSFGNIKFVKIDAEKLSDLAEKYGVSAVPTFVFIKDGKPIDKVEGANPSDLAGKLSKYAQEATSSASNKDDLNARLSQLVNFAPVMLFMKGTPEKPQCGFSGKIVDILKKEGAVFSSFNILSDEQVRNGLREFSNWPTYPQLYINGKLVGGLDVVRELSEEGELATMLPKNTAPAPTATSTATPTPTSAKEDLNTRLEKLINTGPVMLFMKGSPDAPQCGFSSKMVDILRKNNVSFSSFNILQDEEVRSGLKTYSNWPTFPQLYAKGKLVGGLDVVKELAEEGELSAALA